ncbi:MAG TPA: helix-turn-helix domain-containing protein [Acidimicrobiales bacterium]|nr:helix-turn-helix domain-containing protein [Acidimicrobiales bacterium]
MSRAESQARTRQLLLDTAAKVFARRGFTAATVEEISEKAGFSRGAFYANFSDKATIFLAIAEAQQQQDFTELAVRLNKASEEQILDVLYNWFIRVLVHAPLGRALSEFRLAAQDEPALRKRLAAYDQADIDLSARMITDYSERSRTHLSVTPTAFAGMVTALVSGYATRMSLNPKAVEPQEIAQALIALWTAMTQTNVTSPLDRQHITPRNRRKS